MDGVRKSGHGSERETSWTSRILLLLHFSLSLVLGLFVMFRLIFVSIPDIFCVAPKLLLSYIIHLPINLSNYLRVTYSEPAYIDTEISHGVGHIPAYPRYVRVDGSQFTILIHQLNEYLTAYYETLNIYVHVTYTTDRRSAKLIIRYIEPIVR